MLDAYFYEGRLSIRGVLHVAHYPTGMQLVLALWLCGASAVLRYQTVSTELDQVNAQSPYGHPHISASRPG